MDIYNAAHQNVSRPPRMININFIIYCKWCLWALVPRSLLSLVCCSALCFFSIISAGKFSLYWLCKLGPESGKLTRGWNRGHSRGVFFLFRFSCIQWNVYIFMYTINILLQTRELGHCTDMAQSLRSHFALEEIHFSLISYCLGQRQGPPWVADTGQWIFNQLSPMKVKLLVKKFNSLSCGQF